MWISYEEKEVQIFTNINLRAFFQKIGNYVIAINPLSPLSY